MPVLRASVTPWFQSICVLVIATAAFAQQPPTAPVQNPQTENAAKAKGLVLKSITALGGDLYTKVFDMKQTGRGFGFYHNEATGVGLAFTRFYQYPDKDRYEYFKNGEWVVIFVGDQGYETTFRGSHPVEAKDLADYNRRRSHSLDVVLRAWVADPKTAYFYEGTTLIGPKQVHQVTLMNKDNLSETLFIDAKTYLPVQKQYTWRDPETRQMQEEQELYDEYRPVQNVLTPFRITRMKNGEISSQRFLKTVEYNIGVGDRPFAPPVIKNSKTKQ